MICFPRTHDMEMECLPNLSLVRLCCLRSASPLLSPLSVHPASWSTCPDCAAVICISSGKIFQRSEWLKCVAPSVLRMTLTWSRSLMLLALLSTSNTFPSFLRFGRLFLGVLRQSLFPGLFSGSCLLASSSFSSRYGFTFNN